MHLHILMSCLVWCSGTVLRPNTRHAPSPTHHIQAGLCTHRFTTSLYTLTALLALYLDCNDWITTHMMGMQAAGQELADVFLVPRMPHPGPRCAHKEARPLPRPAATASHHMRVAGLSLCVSAVRPLAHHQGSCQAPSLLLHSYHPGSSRVCVHLHGGRWPQRQVATPAGCMHMPPTVCPLLEPTDRHAGQTQPGVPLVVIREHSLFSHCWISIFASSRYYTRDLLRI
jgi:hypothetical protein